jgi:thioredoxin-like negative regulator of GroEL
MPEIEADFPEYQFIEVDRDEYIDVASEWNIFGIPSFVVIQDGKELGRLVNKERKTKEEIETFLRSL